MLADDYSTKLVLSRFPKLFVALQRPHGSATTSFFKIVQVVPSLAETTWISQHRFRLMEPHLLGALLDHASFSRDLPHKHRKECSRINI
jgi:hypothetical protein